MNRHPELAVGLLLLAIHLQVAASPDLSGIWMINGRAVERDLVMTDRALAIQSGYDLLTDDPSLSCEPASVSRVWANPNVRIAFDQGNDNVTISYEFYDLRRRIPLSRNGQLSEMPSTSNVHGTNFKKMGSSFAWYEEDTLYIETRHYEAGYIRTSRGIPQSENTITTEKLWLEGDTLKLELTYVDETLFKQPFVLDHSFQRTGESELPLYECTDASYDWFEKLNEPKE